LSEETVVFNLELNVERALSSARQLETLLFRSLGLMRRLCGDENVDAAIAKFQKLVMTIRLAHTTLILFESASGPIGWAMLGVSAIATALSASEFIAEIS